MSQYLDSLISRQATSHALMQGKDIYSKKRTSIIEQRVDFQKGKATYAVPSSSWWKSYRITIHDFNKTSIYAQCNCAFEGGGICKHIVAAALVLREKSNLEVFRPANEVFNNEPITLEFLRKYTILQLLSEGMHIANTKTGVSFKEATFDDTEKRAFYKVKDQKVGLILRGGTEIVTQCECEQTISKLCAHKVAAFIHLVRQFGEKPFDRIGDLTEEKNRLLSEYGYSLEDKSINRLFEFEMDAGVLKLKPKDPSLEKTGDFKDYAAIRQQITATKVKPSLGKKVVQLPTAQEVEDPVLIYVFKLPPNTTQQHYDIYHPSDPFKKQIQKQEIVRFRIVPTRGLWKKEKLGGRLQELSTDQSYSTYRLADLALFDAKDAELFKHINDLLPEKIGRTFLSIMPRSGYVYTLNKEELNDTELDVLSKLVGEQLRQVFKHLPDKKVYLAPVDSQTQPKLLDLKPIEVLHGRANIEFDLTEDKGFCILKPKITLGELEFHYYPHARHEDWLYYDVPSSKLMLLDTSAVKTLNLLFKDRNSVRVKKDNLSNFLGEFLVPLMDVHNVEFGFPIDLNEGEGIFNCKLYLSEAEESDTLIFTPIFTYSYNGEEKEIEYDSPLRQLVFQKEKESENAEIEEFDVVYRNDEQERKIRQFFEELHPVFAEQSADNPAFFYLDINQLFEKEWFFGAFDKIKEQNIEIFGFNQLSKIKYNPNRAKINIRASSGIDWFDLEMTVSFGEQKVSLKEVKKAIFNKQHYVKLGDGTLGILPQEWLDKFSTALKFGDIKGDKLKLSNMHFSIVEDLYGEIDNSEVLQKLYEKRQKLRTFEQIDAVIIPEKVTATLREYQQAGFNWLNFLDEFGWGGILADDMGLGKTLQAITFLQQQVDKNPTRTNLAVVPKSLVFNWLKECEKFAPELKVMVYYGPFRGTLFKDIEKHNLVVTTYGAVRSDIEKLRDITFNYVILDESQAIKNPDAQASKAVKLLKSDNRLTLTGTPIENNTFDLYSQMDFLNPGLLGNVEFFKREFATPIDRDRDVKATEQLRKLVYPFILRRTKEEVAKELPEKVETVIYCEMDKQQRKVYDGFRDNYRDMILGRIDTDGLGNSSMYILEGLMKLRQICDSPAILNETEDYGSESAKLTELITRLREDAGRHKILVFSQFLGMLELIRKELDLMHVKYEYLDGQTADRQERVENFQSDENCRVFLMSLKAGGVGLNLTAADYVYIVDPWWNPAVEQQAIDRAHRIGQDKSVFAYRMICKDTIEEKILLLQDKKRALSKDLIHVESGFVKGLKREDVVDLFS
jgi:SNF2 family DNA or RNA helicase